MIWNKENIFKIRSSNKIYQIFVKSYVKENYNIKINFIGQLKFLDIICNTLIQKKIKFNIFAFKKFQISKVNGLKIENEVRKFTVYLIF